MFQQDPISFISVLLLAVSPSLIWLFFYLKEDPHPEPRYWLFIIFITGVTWLPGYFPGNGDKQGFQFLFSHPPRKRSIDVHYRPWLKKRQNTA